MQQSSNTLTIALLHSHMHAAFDCETAASVKA